MYVVVLIVSMLYSEFIHIICRVLAKETIYSGSDWLPDSVHSLPSTCYFCKDYCLLLLQRLFGKKLSFEKDFRSTQGKGNNKNAQMKYVILFPYVIQSMV